MTDHFTRLGLPRRFALDSAALEAAYLARSRELHPDFYQAASTAEQQASQDLSAALNDAYRTLRVPFSRADYLLILLGGPSAAEVKDVPPAVLMDALERREQIEQLRRQPNPTALRQLEADLHQQTADLHAQIAAEFARGESANLRAIRSTLNALKYVQNLLHDLPD
jgi:molecular chaperone HscB